MMTEFAASGAVKTAKFEGKVIDAAEGVDIKESRSGKLDFRYVECGSPPRVHRSSGDSPAHFEHLEGNDHCSLVHTRG